MALLLISIGASIAHIRLNREREVNQHLHIAEWKIIFIFFELTFSPVCSRLCSMRYDARLNFLSQSGHLTVLPVCNVMWVFKMVFCENDLSQYLQAYGFSPESTKVKEKMLSDEPNYQMR